MKKTIAILLILSVLLSISACGTDTPEETQPSTESPATSATEDTEATVVPEVTGTSATDPTETTAPPPTETEETEPSETNPDDTEPTTHTHDFNYKITVTGPTCTEKGYTTHTCTCGHLYKSNEIPAKGHNWSGWSVVRAGTCQQGEVTKRTCSACKQTEEKTSESLAAHTYDASGERCTLCGQKYSSEGLSYSLYNGGSSYAVTGIGSCTDSKVIVPEIHQGLPVSRIAGYAFCDCTSLTSIIIPNSVTSLGIEAFNGCYNLTSITIPDSVTVIDSGAFSDCTRLRSITIPDSVTYIGSSAFSGCRNLLEIILDGNHTRYSLNAGLLMDGDTVWCCPGGKTGACVIPDGVKSIDDWAFDGCERLTSITIPDSITSIDGDVFSDCQSLLEIVLAGNHTRYSINAGLLIDGDTVIYCPRGKAGACVIPDGVKTIDDYAFYNCRSLTSITIPDSVTSIGHGAFLWCSSLTSITIPDSVTSIDSSAFSWCSSLTSITIPNSVTSIGSRAFHSCSRVTSITIPNSVTSIGDEAFSWCTRLTEIHYNGTMAQWNAIAKVSTWNENTGNYTVCCTDGQIAKS